MVSTLHVGMDVAIVDRCRLGTGHIHGEGSSNLGKPRHVGHVAVLRKAGLSAEVSIVIAFIAGHRALRSRCSAHVAGAVGASWRLPAMKPAARSRPSWPSWSMTCVHVSSSALDRASAARAWVWVCGKKCGNRALVLAFPCVLQARQEVPTWRKPVSWLHREREIGVMKRGEKGEDVLLAALFRAGRSTLRSGWRLLVRVMAQVRQVDLRDFVFPRKSSGAAKKT